MTGDHDTEAMSLRKPYLRSVVSVAPESLQACSSGTNHRDLTNGILWSFVNLLERIVAVLCLLGLFPLMLIVSITVAVLSRRSPFVAHCRVGRNGRTLWVLKFRTMWGPSPAAPPSRSLVERIVNTSEIQPKHCSDPRITSPFAAFCRKYSVDELPQLWHVVQGEMALIGPRPLTAEEITNFYGSDAARLLYARPGLTGLWQVKGRSSLSLEERRRLDLFMLEHWSLKLYFQILQATVPCVLSGRNAW
jgi:exopolysaccharide production protein ExoY